MEDQDSQVSNIRIQNPNSQSGHDPAESQSWPPLKIEEGGFPSIPFQVKNGDEEVCVWGGGGPRTSNLWRISRAFCLQYSMSTTQSRDNLTRLRYRRTTRCGWLREVILFFFWYLGEEEEKKPKLKKKNTESLLRSRKIK